MPWTRKYWDAIHELYWVPRYLGLKSIPQKQWTKTSTTVTIPRDLTNPSGPLYRRIQSGAAYETYIRRQEEIFNQIWNIAVAVLPGDVIAELFNPFMGWEANCDYSSHSGTVGQRYAELSDGNVTTPDCLLLSERALLAIEIKFNAHTSLEQVAKYLTVLVSEERLGTARSQLGILYVYPVDARKRFTREAGIPPESIGSSSYERIRDATDHPVVRRYISEHRSAFESAMDRLTIACVTWSDISTCLDAYRIALGSGRGDRTLCRLLHGLALEIQEHPLSRVAGTGPR